MKDFYKHPYLKNSDVDMKKLQKQRMEDCGRMERRERDKLARQQIQNPTPESSLFPEPVRIEGDSTIESKLGDYSVARNLFSVEPTKHSRIIGITATVTKPPPPQPGPRIPPQQPVPAFPGGVLGSSSSSSSSSAPTFAPPPSQTNRSGGAPPSHRYPPHPSLAPSSSSQSSRSGSGTYLKQPDPKPTYNGRYPIPHPKNSGSGLGPPPPSSSSSSSSSAPSSMMPNGRLSDKPPITPIIGPGGDGGSTSSSSGSIPNGRFQVPLVPKQQTKYPPIDSPMEPPSPLNTRDVENILKEMTMRTNPVTEIAATPRKEFENKFSFGQPNHHVYAALPPAFKESFVKQPLLPERDKSLTVPKSTDLENDLELSESDDERKKQTPAEPASPTIDNSSDSSDSASSESESEESTGGNKGDTSNRKSPTYSLPTKPGLLSKCPKSVLETSKWNLSKYFRKENDALAQPSPHDSNSNNPLHDATNIKHEPNTIDDSHLSSPTPSPSIYRHETNQMNPLMPMNIKEESAQDFNKVNNSNSGCLELQPNQIKSETFDKSPSSSPEKIQHSDTVESDQIESVLAAATGLAELKPVSEIGTSSNEEETKKQQVSQPAAKSPVKKPVKRRRKVQKDKKSVNCDSSDDEGDLSSANTLSERSRSIEKEKKGRGRPRKNPIVTPPAATSKSPAKALTPVKNTSTVAAAAAAVTNKRDTTATRKTGAARRTSRQNSMVKSREILDTTTDSSSEDDRPAPLTKPSVVPSPTLSASAHVIPTKAADIASRGLMPSGGSHKSSSIAKTENIAMAIAMPATVVTSATAKSSDDDDDDDEDDDDDSSSSSNNSDEERVPSSAERTSPRQQYLSGHRSSSQSHHSTSSSSEDHSDSDSDSPLREDKKIRDKTKSDKNKSDTLRKLFVMGPNRGEGGAKVKGQVLIVDQSEESQSHQTKDTPIIHHEKILSPIAFKPHNNNSNSSSSSMNNDVASHHHPPTSATALNHHLKSPRTSAVAMVATVTAAPPPIAAPAPPPPVVPLGAPSPIGGGVSSISNNTSNSKSPSMTALRTPERISNIPTLNNSNKVHSVNSNNSGNVSANINGNLVNSIGPSITCRIPLSRLRHIPKEWYQNAYSIRDNNNLHPNNSSSNNSNQIQSAPQGGEDDRLRSPKLPLTPKGSSSSSKLNNSMENNSSHNPSNVIANNNNGRLVNSDSIVNQSITAATSPASVRLLDGVGLSSKSNHNNRLGKDSGHISPSLAPHNQSLPPPQPLVPPKHEQLMHAPNLKSVTAAGIKQESIKSEFTADEYMNYPPGAGASSKPQNLIDNKCNIYNNPKLGTNNNVKQEQFIKNEYKNSFLANDCGSHNNNNNNNNNQATPVSVVDPMGGGAVGTVPPPMTAINASCVGGPKSTSSDEPIPKSRRKRSFSSSSSPYKEKKRKKSGAQPQNEALEQLPPTNHDRLADKYSPPPPPIIQKVYKSYFEREDDDVRLGQDEENYLQEAKRLKHLADRETGHFNQVALYLKAVLYFLLSGSGMEQEDRMPSAFTMYKDTLAMIKFISSKLKLDNKAAILSLRCQSLISLKLYQLKRVESREAQKTITHYFTKGAPEILNGNTPSISPSSVSSLGSGSNTPPLHMVPVQVHAAFQKQSLAYNYISSAHELWEQADNLVRKGTHTEFFIDLDRVNGPLTLHSSIFELFKYVQAGLQKLKEM